MQTNPFILGFTIILIFKTLDILTIVQTSSKLNHYLLKLSLTFVDYRERKLISNFTGLPLADDPRKLIEPAKFTDVIDQVWESWKIGTETSPEQKISENWGKLVGMQLANKCAPERLDLEKGLLLVRSSSSTVKQELTFKKKGLIKKISGLSPDLRITKIRIH